MGETSESIRKRVQAARNIQLERYGDRSRETLPSVICNADMRVGEIRKFCGLQDEGVSLSLSKCQSLMRTAMMPSSIYRRAPVSAREA